ncbi:MAG: UDP-glucose/GDP-mannose dehydrogenase family protein [Burkholderiales bacterium]|nr:UDP-glucose/GDP-mannose dehydrogenase family protein [Burkholderiales bacterium]
MKISVIGAGYVGLVTSACLADMGNSVVCLDVDPARLRVLREGGVPIHEPGLEALLRHNVAARRLAFTDDAAHAVGHGTIVFIAVGTPAAEDGSADLEHVLAAATTIGRHMVDYKVVVDKSTVPVGTADRVREVIAAQLHERCALLPFAVVSNPEFLKEGAAIEDFMRPDRVIVGSDDERATLLMRALYAPFLRNRDRLLVMDVRSAELTKYAANAMLATRISFMNELAGVAERVGADVEQVRLGLGSDPRIGTHFLYAGCGWGGSCLPKDVKALRRTAADLGMDMQILGAVQAVNERQRRLLVERAQRRFGPSLRGRRFALWGLAFKPGTDDLREAPALEIIEALLQAGATVQAYDPAVGATPTRLLTRREGFSFADDPLAAADDADALMIVTEWREFRSPDFEALRARLREPVIFDGRNIFEPQQMAALGFEYHGIGRGQAGYPGARTPAAPLALIA